MILRELYIESFGQFKKTRILLGEGIHVIYGENETGKSTIHAFIKGMLFGIERKRGRAAKNDTYSRYEPWDQPNYFAGMIRFSCGDKTFRLERNFEKSRKEARLLCETDGEELSVEQGDLEMLLDGLTESTYDNTISIGQLKTYTDEKLSSAVQNYMSNYEDSGDTQVDVEAAIGELKKKQRKLNIKYQELKSEEKKKRHEIEIQRSYIQQEIQSKERLKQETLKQYERAKDALIKEEQELKKGEKELEDAVQEPILPYFVIALFVILLASFLPSIGLKLGFSLLGIGGILLLWFIRKKHHRNLQIFKDGKDQKINMSKEETLKAMVQHKDKLSWSLDRLEEELQERYTMEYNKKELLDEWMNMTVEEKDIQEKISSISLAIDTIKMLSEDLAKEMSGDLEWEMSSILKEVTKGRYHQVKLDEHLGVTLYEGYQMIRLEQVSKGTIEQVYFALRMAVTKKFWTTQSMPLLFDESFAMYDESRLIQALHWLSKNSKQSLIFTCHKREEELLNQEGIPYSTIRL
ncbi:MAG TPA: AAA family ATPase [Candidatus Merdenecus merdavium]|nr:AAA family ATPase [Candidatus Merdenecus merdavium]